VDSSFSAPRGERFPKGKGFGHTGFTGTSSGSIREQDGGRHPDDRVHPDDKGNVTSYDGRSARSSRRRWGEVVSPIKPRTAVLGLSPYEDSNALSATRPQLAARAAVYAAAVYALPDLDALDDIYEGRSPGYIYARTAHPNAHRLADQLAKLEAAKWGVVCGSGMASLSAAFLATLTAGDHRAGSSRLYGRTTKLLRQELHRFGVKTCRSIPATSTPPAPRRRRTSRGWCSWKRSRTRCAGSRTCRAGEIARAGGRS